MNYEECRRAAENYLPIVNRHITSEIVYKRIKSLIWRYSTPEQIAQGDPKIVLELELEDKSGRSVTFANPKECEIWTQKE